MIYYKCPLPVPPSVGLKSVLRSAAGFNHMTLYNRQIDRHTQGRIDRHTQGRIDRQTQGRIDRHTQGQIDR